MTSATSSSVEVPAMSQLNTKELVKKIKAITSTSLSLKDRPAVCARPSSESSKRPVSSNQTLQPKSLPSDRGRTSPKIQIIYCAKTHQRQPSPPPKSLTRTFPCPPEINFPNETKIQLHKSAPVKSAFPQEDCVETTTVTPFSDDIKVSTDGSNMELGSSSRVSACVVNLGLLVSAAKGTTRSVAHNQADIKTLGFSVSKTRGRVRRGGILWTPQSAIKSTKVSKYFQLQVPQTRLELNFCEGAGSEITVNLGKLTVSACDKPTTGKPNDHTSLPRWLERLPERNEVIFHLNSALEYRVYYSEHPRLYDKFVSEAFARLHAKISRLVRNEADWDSLRHIWG